VNTAGCNATSPTVQVAGLPARSYRCELPADHEDYHRAQPTAGGAVAWRDPEPILGEPKPWHPDHKPHAQAARAEQ
jgi:hypothetical protein